MQTVSDTNARRYRTGGNWITKAMLWAVVGLYCGLRVWSLWTPRLWGDEIFTFSLAQGSWLSLIKRAGLDMAHPPLFYSVLKLWVFVAGNSVSLLRVLPVAFSIATVLPVLALGRKLKFHVNAVILTLTVMAVNNYLIVYSYYLRSYSLVLLLALSSQAMFVDFLQSPRGKEKRSLIILTLINSLFIYTHYFASLVVATQLLWIIAFHPRRLKQFMVSVAIVVLVFLPWIGVLIYVSHQVHYTLLNQISWFRPPGINNLILLLRCFNGGFNSIKVTLAGSAIILFITVAGFLTTLRRSDSEPDISGGWQSYALLAWLSLFPVLVSYTVSRIFTWIWEPRYVIVGAGSYLLLVAAGTLALRPRYLRFLAIAFLLCWTFSAGYSDNLAVVLHGPNAPSVLLAQSLSQTEPRPGPVNIYGISPYAEQGLRLAFNLTGERRFKTITCSPDIVFPDDYFWIAITEPDLTAMARLQKLSTDSSYVVGEPLYSGEPPQRHILVPIQRR